MGLPLNSPCVSLHFWSENFLPSPTLTASSSRKEPEKPSGAGPAGRLHHPVAGSPARPHGVRAAAKAGGARARGAAAPRGGPVSGAREAGPANAGAARRRRAAAAAAAAAPAGRRPTSGGAGAGVPAAGRRARVRRPGDVPGRAAGGVLPRKQGGRHERLPDGAGERGAGAHRRGRPELPRRPVRRRRAHGPRADDELPRQMPRELPPARGRVRVGARRRGRGRRASRHGRHRGVDGRRLPACVRLRGRGDASGGAGAGVRTGGRGRARPDVRRARGPGGWALAPGRRRPWRD